MITNINANRRRIDGHIAGDGLHFLLKSNSRRSVDVVPLRGGVTSPAARGTVRQFNVREPR